MVKFTFLLLIFLMITVNITTSKILIENEPKKCSNEHQKMIQILKRCFQNAFSTIITKLESNECVTNFLEELPDTPIILNKNDDKMQNQAWLFSGFPIYVLEINSAKDLKTTLTTLGSLQWWNRELLFFLVGSSNNSCIDAKKILSTMWTETILSTIYVCYDHKNNIHKIFTYNPFTNRAPKPWKLSEDNSSGRWTLYEQHYQENDEICLNLMFDKTKYLDGYEITASYKNRYDVSVNNSSLYAWVPIMNTPMNFLALDLVKLLNISMSVIEESLDIKLDCHVKSRLKLETSEYDIILNGCPLMFPHPYKTHPFFQVGFSIFTEKRPFLRPEEKILWYYFQSKTVVFIFVVMIIVSAKVLQKNKPQKFSGAVLKIWQSVFSFTIRDAMTKFWVRFYFFGMFLLFLIVSETFKSNLAAFLTKPDRINVDSIQDLINLGYRIYVPSFYKCFSLDSITPNIPANKLFLVEEPNCARYIDNRTACINSYIEMKFVNSTKGKKFHLSNKIPWASHIVWLTSAKFPLKQRFNTAILRYVQSGIIDHWYSKYVTGKEIKLTSIEHDEVKAEFRPIELDDLVFAFKFLIIGLFCSFVVFIMEIRRG